MSETQYDLAVIGSGPGGYVAAIRAAQLGMKTAIIEREHLGGICLNWGCIPTKALLRTSELYQAMRRAPEFGLAADNVRFDIAAVVERSRKVAERLSNGVGYLMRKNKVEVIKGTARLAGEGRIAVTGAGGEALHDIAAKHIIVATGARARTLPGLEPDGRLIWTYREAMVPPSFPKSLLIVGSGAIGIEFASFYHSLGAEVTVVEVLDRILPVEDAEISGGVEVYSATEAANGELGFYIVSRGGGGPYKIKVRPPCFPLFQGMPHLVEGQMIADLIAVLGSVNIIAGELDR